MSDIRKAIMARLGEFARPGVPAAVLDGISAGVNALYSQAREYHNEGDRELAKSRKKDADDLGAIAVLVRSGDGGAEHAKRIASSIFKLDTEVRDWVGDSMWKWLRRMKAIHSRPGAKAEMGRAEDLYRKLNVSVTLANSKEMERLASEALRMPDFMPEGNDWSLHELAEEAGREVLALKSRASRPGAKAEMGNAEDVRSLIAKAEQMIWTAKRPEQKREVMDLVKDAERMIDASMPSGFRMRLDRLKQRIAREFSRPGAKAAMAKFNSGDSVVVPYGREMVRGKIVRYDEPSMAYVVDIGRYESIKVAKEDVRKAAMSRPGAKAKMAKWTVVMPSIPDAGTRHFDSWEQAKNYVDTKMGGFTALVSVDGKRYALKHALGQWEKFSRPGAKSTNALYMIEIVEGGRVTSTITPDQFRNWAVRNIPGVSRNDFLPTMIEKSNEWMRKFDGSQVRIGGKSKNALSDACWQGYEAVGTKKQDGKTVPNCVPKATAAKPESQDIESEEVKAGLKFMEKADEKVSEKIRTLIKEGKPQDQAVAIALDMKRRGEL